MIGNIISAIVGIIVGAVLDGLVRAALHRARAEQPAPDQAPN